MIDGVDPIDPRARLIDNPPAANGMRDYSLISPVTGGSAPDFALAGGSLPGLPPWDTVHPIPGPTHGQGGNLPGHEEPEPSAPSAPIAPPSSPVIAPIAQPTPALPTPAPAPGSPSSAPGEAGTVDPTTQALLDFLSSGGGDNAEMAPPSTAALEEIAPTSASTSSSGNPAVPIALVGLATAGAIVAYLHFRHAHEQPKKPNGK